MGKNWKQPAPNQPRQVVQQTTHQQITWRFPFPPPAMIEHYNRILPGAADRILKMAELQAEHRRELEKHVISGDVGRTVRGQWFGLFIGAGALVLAGYLVSIGKNLEAVAVVFSDFAALATTFIVGRRATAKERADQRGRSIGNAPADDTQPTH